MPRVNYKFDLYTDNGKIDNDGFSALQITNQGTSTIMVANVLQVRPGCTFELKHRPGEIIDTSFTLLFESETDLINSVVVVRGYYV